MLLQITTQLRHISFKLTAAPWLLLSLMILSLNTGSGQQLSPQLWSLLIPLLMAQLVDLPQLFTENSFQFSLRHQMLYRRWHNFQSILSIFDMLGLTMFGIRWYQQITRPICLKSYLSLWFWKMVVLSIIWHCLRIRLTWGLMQLGKLRRLSHLVEPHLCATTHHQFRSLQA